MKALVLAGGAGTRLRPFTHSLPKQLVPVANRPVIRHVLESVREVGVTRVGIVIDQHCQQIPGALGDGSSLGMEITYIRQDQPRGLAHCVQISRGFLGDEDFVMFLGDNILPEGVAAMAGDFRSGKADAQVAVQKVSDPRAFGVVELGEDQRVLRLVEKPQEPRSDLALIGVYFFTAAVHEAVRSIAPSARGELEITEALQWMLSRGQDVRARVYSGYWKDTGTIEDLLECNRELLAALRHRVDGSVDSSSRLVGPVVLEEGARVTGSVITGPAIIGRDTVVDHSEVGPHTSVGPRCTLRGAGVGSSIVQAEAAIEGVCGISDSVIGRRSLVTASPYDHQHLVIGDDAMVRLVGR